jgi:hypothetical protein
MIVILQNHSGIHHSPWSNKLSLMAAVNRKQSAVYRWP